MPTLAPSDPNRPRWQHLPPALQQDLLAPLTRMLQQHLSARAAAKEVADESR